MLFSTVCVFRSGRTSICAHQLGHTHRPSQSCRLRSVLAGNRVEGCTYQTVPAILCGCCLQTSKKSLRRGRNDNVSAKLQGLVYDILPSTTAVFSYATGSTKLSANEQFFVGTQTIVSLLQTTQIISDVCFITDHVSYASSYKTKIV